MLRNMVDVELSIEEILQLLKQLCERPMWQGSCPVKTLPRIRQRIAYNQVLVLAIHQFREIIGITDRVADLLKEINEIRLE